MRKKITPEVQVDKELSCLTVEEVAALFKIGVRTVWRLVQEGSLPAPHAIGRKLRRWAHADIEAFLHPKVGAA